MIFLIFCLCFPLFCLLFHKSTCKFLNPYKLIFVFGKKGSGKSTLLQKLSFQYACKGWTVYSTEVPDIGQIVPFKQKKKHRRKSEEEEQSFVHC